MIEAASGEVFDVVFEGVPTGLVGTLGVRVVDPTTQTTVVARTTAGIVEYPAGSGVYAATLTAPTLPDDQRSPWAVSVLWDLVAGGAPLTPDETFTEDLLVHRGAVPAATPEPGTPYFTVAEFRARYPEVKAADWTDEQVEATRAVAQEAIEDICGPFLPRVETGVQLHESHDRSWDTDLAYRARRGRQLPFTDALSITAANDRDGNPITLTGVGITDGWAHLPTGWPAGAVTVTLTHGRAVLPLRVKQAAMALTKQWMVLGPITAREMQLATEQGGVINMSSPGRFGSFFGLPEVDAVIQIYANRAVRLA